MSTHLGPSPTAPTSAVRNTIGREKEMSQGNLNGLANDATLREYGDKHYNQLLPILAEKMHREKVQQEKLKAVKARLNFEEVSQHFESVTPSRMRDLRKRLGSRRIRSVSGNPKPRRGRSESPRKRDPKRKTVLKMLEKVAEILKVVTRVPAQEEHNLLLRNIITKEHRHAGRKRCQKVKVAQDDTKSHDQKSKDQALRMTIYPSHRYARKLIRSLPVFAILISRRGPVCQVTSKHMTEKKCIKDPVEILHIKQREGESTEDFMHRCKIESSDVKGATEVMRISGFVHGITNPELIKRLHDKIPKSIDKMMRITTSFLGGGSCRKTKSNKFCEFHGEVGHNTDECMHLKRQIEELLKNGKLSHVIKELKQNTVAKVARQRITQSFSPDPEISFPPLDKEKETEGPMIIEAEIGGHFIHCMYVDGGSALEILYEHCFNRLLPKIKNQMVPATAPLIGFSGEIIWPSGKISLLVKIGDEEHSTSAWMNFVIVRSSSPYNGIIERPGVMIIQVVSSTAHGMLKFPVAGDILTIKSSKIIPIECVAISGPEGQPLAVNQATEERIKGYHQIKIAKEDEEKTSFITSQGIFCYSKMPFGLRNVGATYQRLVGKAFHKQIGGNLEVYVDDLVIKSRTKDEIISDIEETFKTLREINMKLNPKKCTFGVEEGMFPGYKVNTKGIKVCLDKVDAVLSLPSSKCLKDVQKLNGKLASLNRFEATNNEAEYEALIAGLRMIAEHMGVKNLQANMDSRLVVNQVNRTYIAKEADMICKQVLVEEHKEKSINKLEVLAVVEEEGDTWMTPIYEYLIEETLPAEVNKARAVRRKSHRFAVINGVMYKKSFLRPWLRCVGPLQANYVLGEIHEGSCSMHANTISIVAKALRMGYYWPTMHKDARALIKACQDCQVHRLVPRNPPQKLTPIKSSWPFYKWGIDIVGPFSKGSGKDKFLIVAIDYFRKWIEAKPVTTITGNQVKKFMWDNVVCKFGLPGEIISNNGKQFRDNPFKDWCERRRNQSKARRKKQELDGRNLHVLWAHRTMIKSSNGGTPFLLTYGTEAVIPKEVDMSTLRTAKATICEAKSKEKMEKYYNSKVRSTSFKPGDIVYRINDASHAQEVGKLGSRWEGPYEVTKALGKGAYKLRDRDEKQLSQT
nr:reverse transcriptase domain-containing protein [Tanacetum cinerariifolium]